MWQAVKTIGQSLGAVLCLGVIMMLAVPALADMDSSLTRGRTLSKSIELTAYQQPELSGVVTDAAGTPLSNIEVFAYPLPSNIYDTYVPSTTSTDENGRYTFSDIVDGSTIVRFRDITYNYVQEYYSDVYTEADATAFVINPAAPVEINASLDVGGSATGNLWVPDWSAGPPPRLTLFKKVDPDIPDDPYPSPYNNYRNYWNFSTEIRESAGTYRVQGLEPGTYIIMATTNGVRHYFNGPRPEDAQAFNVALGTETTGINISFLSPTSLELADEPTAPNWFDKLFVPFISQ